MPFIKVTHTYFPVAGIVAKANASLKAMTARGKRGKLDYHAIPQSEFRQGWSAAVRDSSQKAGYRLEHFTSRTKLRAAVRSNPTWLSNEQAKRYAKADVGEGVFAKRQAMGHAGAMEYDVDEMQENWNKYPSLDERERIYLFNINDAMVQQELEFQAGRLSPQDRVERLAVMRHLQQIYAGSRVAYRDLGWQEWSHLYQTDRKFRRWADDYQDTIGWLTKHMPENVQDTIWAGPSD